MKETKRKSIQLGDLAMYLEDLLKMGFVSEDKNEKGEITYKLTELGRMSGLKDIPEREP